MINLKHLDSLDVSKYDVTNSGLNALHIACYHGNINCVDYLLKE